MTLDDTRNAMAEMAGWSCTSDNIWYRNEKGPESTKSVRAGLLPNMGHPIPASLDWLVKAWPDDFGWAASPLQWRTWRGDTLGPDVERTGAYDQPNRYNELLDRFTLLYKVAEWLRDNDRPAFDALMEKWRKLV